MWDSTAAFTGCRIHENTANVRRTSPAHCATASSFPPPPLSPSLPPHPPAFQKRALRRGAPPPLSPSSHLRGREAVARAACPTLHPSLRRACRGRLTASEEGCTSTTVRPRLQAATFTRIRLLCAAPAPHTAPQPLLFLAPPPLPLPPISEGERPFCVPPAPLYTLLSAVPAGDR